MRTFARLYFGLQKYIIIANLNKINCYPNSIKIMKKINIRSLYSLFLFLALGATALAQTNDSIENYYSNPKNGIKPAAPKPYHDTSVVSKTDNLTVNLTGYIPDTTPVADTTPSSLQLDPRSLRRESCGLLYTWDPWDYWYYSCYDPWCYSSWGFGWSIYGPHWAYGYHWGWYHYWGTPWFYDYYYYYPYYYYPNYTWHGDLSHGRNPNSGYGLIPNARGGNAVGNTRSGNAVTNARGSNPSPTTNRGTVRRGGVDLNNGGRAPRGRVSGSRYTKPTSRGTSDAARGNVASSSNSRSSSSYGTSSSRSSYGRSSSSTFRSENSNPSRSSNSTFRSNSSSSRSSSSTFRSNSSSSRSSSSSFRSSSSPSRSTSSSSFRGSSSPSRSSSSTSSRSISGGRR